MQPHPPPSPSFGERRGHQLAPLQTNFSRPTAAQSKSAIARHQRPRPTDYLTSPGSEQPIPLLGPVKRQSSKPSLRNLFTRDRSHRAAAGDSNAKLVGIDENRSSINPNVSAQIAHAAVAEAPPFSPSVTSPLTAVYPPELTSPTTPRPRSTLKTVKTRPAAVESKTPLQEQYGWKPPPLFQAYPQAYKHDCLSTPSMSADAILRLHATTGNASAEQIVDEDVADATRKKKDKERKHLRTLSGTMNKVEWTDKIYVLVTAGYILQYAGEGKNDRLPEKMLQLGAQSVAFASDAIPGKHWVLQVSQSSGPGGSSAIPERSRSSRFSRFGFHRSSARRLARSFLLVFDNPDSMIAWLVAVRQEIEVRGGPKLTEEKHLDDDQVPRLRSKSSTRSIVKKDPHRISSLFMQSQGLVSPEEEGDDRSAGPTAWQSRRSSYVSTKRHSLIGSRRGSESTCWTETPSHSSDAQMPPFDAAGAPSCPPEEPVHPAAGGRGDNTYSTPSFDASNLNQRIAKRQSNFAISQLQACPPAPLNEAASFNRTPPLLPESFTRCASPPAPNFSVPSFSKKFVTRPGPPPNVAPPAPLGARFQRVESFGDVDVSGISSPPHSPTYSINSYRPTDTTHSSMMQQEAHGRRVLRPSNSEDTLPRAVRPVPNAAHLLRLPYNPSSGVGSPSSRPQSLVGRSGLGIHIASQEPALMKMPTLESVSLSCPRTAAASPAQGSQPIPRRKSMPGLSAGPPVAPPPNCPLPQIPPALMSQAATAGRSA
ncbi:hypothetical protein N7539_005954 [Penicillium diatomitis]|uniref:Peptidase family M20/M25/M40 protein n=1 Tax=Penicillium diatomitis TaxID=2819901 RepID=A0A9W9X5B1_9EURO|nr:uncharacterized protein N7539_005954 [Penicillium diatomitis]KAJ5484158.1 hypothetical protein N7539_005954 [Penicillium diatomitis]